MKISIIITTYKREMSVLKRAISSAINQTYSDKEIIVVNDYPMNQKIIDESFENYNIQIYHNKTNMGACVSRNLGASYSSGDYIAFMDDDDEWIPTKLEKQAFQAEKGADFIYCRGTGIFENGETTPMYGIKKIRGNILDMILSGNCFGGCSFPLIRREVFFDAGTFDPTFESSQDHDLWIRIAEKYQVAFCDDALVVYHIGKKSITGNKEKRIQGYDRMLEKYSNVYRSHKNAAVKLLYGYFKCSIQLGLIKSAYRYALMSFEFFPLNLKFFSLFCSSLLMTIKKQAIKLNRKYNLK